MHSMEAGTYTDMQITRLERCQKNGAHWGKIVREAKVGFSSLSSKFVCDGLIKSMKEEGEQQVT